MPVHSFPVTTTGEDGVAAGSVTTFALAPGAVLDAIKLDYGATAPASTDVTITEVGGLQRTVLAVANSATDGVYYPRHTTHDESGADTAGQQAFLLEGALTIAVAQSNALAPAVTVSIQTIQNMAAR